MAVVDLLDTIPESKSELRAPLLAIVPELAETFHAITVRRHFEPPLLTELLRRPESDVLGLPTT